MAVPIERIRTVNAAPVRPERAFVLYWMIASRRVRWNPSLERAVELARELGCPLVVLEALRCGYRYASDRLHAFVVAGMADNARRLAGRALYHPYLEPAPGEGKGLLAALGARACAVVTDDTPAFFLPRMIAAAGAALDVRLEAVDGCGLVPFRAPGREFPTAYAFRRWLQRELPARLSRLPVPDPLARQRLAKLASLPREIVRRWPAMDRADLARPAALLTALPIDHAVPPAPLRGGAIAAEARLADFLDGRLARYAAERASPAPEATSGLSPYLHFGHLSPAQVVRAILDREGWTPLRLAPDARGARAGWWGLSPSAEAFLDQLVTWREVGYVNAGARPDGGAYEALPAWARATLERHAADPRPAIYAPDALAEGRTGDPLWNAAQRQLREDGVLHNTLRMLWGKRVLEWTRSPREALEVALALNDRWALDGRDPSSVTGVSWCLGRYDRPWGPERPIFGTVRYMSSRNLARKVPLDRYLARFGDSVRAVRTRRPVAK